MAIRPHSETVGIGATWALPTGIGVELDVSVSPSFDVTVAVFEIVPLVAVTCVDSAIVALPPAAIVPRLQESGFALLQVPCDGVAETNVSPAGSVSVTTTFVAGDGPAFVTVIV